MISYCDILIRRRYPQTLPFSNILRLTARLTMASTRRSARLATAAAKPSADETTPSTKVEAKASKGRRRRTDEDEMHGTNRAATPEPSPPTDVKTEADAAPPATPPRKRFRVAISTPTSTKSKIKQEFATPDTKSKIKQELDTLTANPATPDRGTPSAKLATPAGKSPRKPKYGLTPGQTPFPDWPYPTAEQCQHVSDLLSEMHGYRPEAPKVIPTPSTTIAGCGEVPSVLDALIRTLLSAATSLANSSRSFQGIVKHYGLLEDGPAKGSPDWNKVRLGTEKELFEVIKCGGLAAGKSKNIKTILDTVYEENMARREALVKAKAEDDDSKGPPGIKNESKEERDMEITKTDHDILSLDHLHSLPNEEAMAKLISYPGIGVKTAACTMLFCMSRPSFAVDTHVWRLCKWLGWVPPHASRDQTYMHCDLRIPDKYKYELHALFWKHGKYW